LSHLLAKAAQVRILQVATFLVPFFHGTSQCSIFCIPELQRLNTLPHALHVTELCCGCACSWHCPLRTL